jgi:hypothetical protein
MSIDPKRVAVQVALRSLQLQGTDQASLDASYVTGYTALDGAEVPATALVDSVVAIEGQLADLIGGDKQNPYRSNLYGRSDDLASGEIIPTEDEDGIAFVGLFSQINSSDDDLPLTEQPIEVIRRFLRGSYTTEIYNYSLQAGRFYHTRDRAYFEGCSWSRTQAYQRFGSGTLLSPIPIAYEPVWIAGTLAFLAQEGWFSSDGGYYAQLAAQGIAMIKNRETEMPVLPTAMATAAPAAN